MREIKFRIFWRHPESDSSGFEYFKAGEKIAESDPCQEYDSIEQYTGLKDKNGKDIYEGDIVMFHQFLFDGYGEVEHEMICSITFDEYGLCLEYDDPEKGGPLACMYGVHEESFEIIGNIHENPELLNA